MSLPAHFRLQGFTVHMHYQWSEKQSIAGLEAGTALLVRAKKKLSKDNRSRNA